MAGKTLLTMAGRGAELRDLLMQELSIPRSCKWFEVRFGVEEPVTVRCEFYARELPETEEDPEATEAPNHGGLNG